MGNYPSDRPSAWAHIRTLFIAVHLLAITLMALPAPSGGMSRSAWKDPTVQAEFRAWTERVNALGIEMTQDELQSLAWDFSLGFLKARTRVLGPFGPYYRYAGTAQSWRMFVAPHRFPARLEFRILEDGRWRTIYQARSPEHRWMAQELDHDRFRSAVFRYGWSHHRVHYRQFAQAYGRRALAEFPEAEAFEARFYKYRTLSPEEARAGLDPDGRYTSSEVITR